ncbi:hypothetical protein ACHAP5_004252 [Fusarium lateritium]
MPPKKSTNASKKRAHDDADANQGASKSARTEDAPAEEHSETSTGPKGSRKRRISRGPKGEPMMPQYMPRECAEAKVIETIPMPSRWVAGIDAIPDRAMTLGSRKWWEDHGPWLEANKKALKLPAAKWKMRDEAMKQDDTVADDEGADDWDFVCYPIPRSERARVSDEDDEDEDDEDEEDEDEEDEEGDGNGKSKDGEKDKDDDKEKPYDKLASLHPDWPWSFTMRGIDRCDWWQQEALKRNQDEFDMHIYNDFTGYGMHEVMENIFGSVFKPKASYRDFWPEVEGMAMVLRSGLIDYMMCDDPDKCESISEMVGYLTLATIDALKKQDVFKPDSEIRNLGTVLFMLIRWGREQIDYDFSEECCSWIYKVIDLAEEANVQLAAPHNFDKAYDEIVDNRDKRAKKMKRWDKVSWPAKVKAYTTKHIGGARAKLGGHQYDITKFTKAKRDQYSFRAGGGWDMM